MTALTHEQLERLIAAASRAMAQSYAPFSRFRVGAALLTASGEVVGGTNVENSSYGLTMCAERVAVGTAVAAGTREVLAIAIVTDTPEPASPCGACRQVLYEFGPDMQVVMATLGGASRVATLRELLPHGFRLEP